MLGGLRWALGRDGCGNEGWGIEDGDVCVSGGDGLLCGLVDGRGEGGNQLKMRDGGGNGSGSGERVEV